LQVKNLVKQDMVISDSCHAGELGEHFMNSVRRLYEAIGANVVELENNRFDSLCCGFASYLRSGDDPTGVSRDTQRKMKQILATGIDDISFNCHGCKSHLSAEVKGTNLKLHLAMDDILKAFKSSP